MRSRREYLAIQHEGRRRTTPHFVLLLRPTPNRMSRLGITVSRKVGDAVARNHVKRCVREWFRRHCERIAPPADLVVIAKPAASTLTCPAIAAELTRSLCGGKPA